MRIQDEKRIGPGDDLGTVVNWQAGEQSIDLLTTHELTVTVEPDDLDGLRKALEELDRLQREGA